MDLYFYSAAALKGLVNGEISNLEDLARVRWHPGWLGLPYIYIELVYGLNILLC